MLEPMNARAEAGRLEAAGAEPQEPDQVDGSWDDPRSRVEVRRLEPAMASIKLFGNDPEDASRRDRNW